jgi:TATA-box binding protein (TBP) (component of TFIID and TFIIIB)
MRNYCTSFSGLYLHCIIILLKKIKMPLFIFASGNCFLSGHRPWQDPHQAFCQWIYVQLHESEGLRYVLGATLPLSSQ